MPHTRSLLFLLPCLALTGCRHAAPSPLPPASPETKPAAEALLQQLTRYLTGSFSSQAQSKQDSRFFDIRLHMVPIWQERTDGPWLYVEQAAATALDKPYRQRVYRLSALPDGRLVSAVYLLPDDALKYAGAWRRPELLAGVTPEQLIPREGCSIFMRAEGQPPVFLGSTTGRQCPSELRGARYATSEVTLREETLETWDRGYDAQDQQVWGSKEGAYRFERVQEAPSAP